MRCPECDKNIYLSMYVAQNAAIIYGWIYAKEYDIYECPVRSGDYHLSTSDWRRKQAGSSREAG